MKIVAWCLLAVACCLLFSCAPAGPVAVQVVPLAPFGLDDPAPWSVHGRIHLQWFDDTRVLLAVDSDSEGRKLDGAVEHLFLINLAYAESPRPVWNGTGTVLIVHGVLRVASADGDERLLLLFGTAAATGGRRPPPGDVLRALAVSDSTTSKFQLGDFDGAWARFECLENIGTGCFVFLEPKRTLKFPVKMSLQLMPSR